MNRAEPCAGELGNGVMIRVLGEDLRDLNSKSSLQGEAHWLVSPVLPTYPTSLDCGKDKTEGEGNLVCYLEPPRGKVEQKSSRESLFLCSLTKSVTVRLLSKTFMVLLLV